MRLERKLSSILPPNMETDRVQGWILWSLTVPAFVCAILFLVRYYQAYDQLWWSAYTPWPGELRALMAPFAQCAVWTLLVYPVLAVVALGLSRCEGVVPLANKVGKKYSTFFCCLLYLTIGPLFAIPRCASTSFSVGAVGLLGDDHGALYLALFSLLFFAVVLAFSLRPSGIMTWIGKLLNPVFLAFLFALVIAALAARGRSRIADTGHIDRGYACFVQMLTELGAQIEREMPCGSTCKKKTPSKNQF